MNISGLVMFPEVIELPTYVFNEIIKVFATSPLKYKRRGQRVN